MDSFEQDKLRLDIFAWLEEKLAERPWLTRDELLNGYSWRGERIPLISTQKGIWNPQILDETLSVLTSVNSPYKDSWNDQNGNLIYSYERSETGAGSNTKLRRAFETQRPIIYFEAIEAGKYVARYPVYVVGDDPGSQSFVMNLAGIAQLPSPEIEMNEIQREWQERQVLQRVHQPKFRAQVIRAYDEQCAICNLKHVELLDAAHIVSDRHEKGIAAIVNGLALCKIHHTAYDKNILGITPDYQVLISARVLNEVDGPMLKYGIQAMHERPLTLPTQENLRPSRELLDMRFGEFQRLSA